MKNTFILTAFLFALFSIAYAQNAFDVESSILNSMKGQPTKEIFKTYHYLHEKLYELNSEEGLKRYKIFKANLKWMKEANEKRGEEVYGITQFADLTNEEYIQKHTMNPDHLEAQFKSFASERFLSEEHHYHHHEHHHHHHDDGHDHHHDDEKHHHGNDHHGQDKDNNNNGYRKIEGNEIKGNEEKGDLRNSTEALPDWRKWDGPVKNQGSCGSCWAFSAVSAIENAYHQLKGNYTNFAEQYLVDCNSKNGGCQGGWMHVAFEFVKYRGLLTTKDYPYIARQQSCDTKWQSKEWKILKGWEFYWRDYPRDPTSWDALIKKGPLAICVDARVREYQHYRPGHFSSNEKFPAFESNDCRRCTHAVTAVAVTEENGKKYVIARNSWGTRWGVGGYSKAPMENNCLQTTYGLLPKVEDAKVPDDDVKPQPDPIQEDCVELYGWNGFSQKPRYRVCDSEPQPGNYAFKGVKFPAHRNSTNPLSLRLFKYFKCYGWGPDYKDFVPIEETTEYPMYNGEEAWSGSLAYQKPAVDGCASFYMETCLKGSPMFNICNDVHDTSGVNLDKLRWVNSISFDHLKIYKVLFFRKPNFQGKYLEINPEESLYNIGWRFRRWFKYYQVRSIKLLMRHGQ